ncbi:MAG: carbamoyltransferase [Myxococcota bacterium]
MRVLGLSGTFHDAAAALVVDGRLVAFAQEERFSRRKNDASLPMRAAAFCLRQGGLTAADLDLVAWHEKPLLKLERVLLTSLRTWPLAPTAFRRAMVSMFGDKMWIRHHLVRDLGVDPRRVVFAEHHASHATAALRCSPFPDAAVLCVDGVGEWATTSTWDAERPLDELHFPHSLGLLYSVFTAFLGFEVNEGEYKVMGLAAFGEPRYREALDKVVERQADGSFALRMEHFRFHRDPDRSWEPSFEALFGAPRAPGEPVEQRHKDIAASVQALTEEILLDLATRLHARTGKRHLCLGGGVALNCVAVGRILREGPFDDVFVMPAPGDAGSALGAALLAAGGPQVTLEHAAWGAALDPDEVRRVLVDGGIAHREVADPAVEAAERLARGEVIGWMQGRFELGPRALGQRSILANPRDPATKERLNRKVKHREPFRPFAPSVLAEASADHFVLPRGGAWTRRFMTSTVPAKDPAALAAALHVDGTARVQEVHADAQPLYARLLGEVGRRTGVPAVVNTSFNLAGEPMVASLADGWSTFLRTDLDALVVGPYVVERSA